MLSLPEPHRRRQHLRRPRADRARRTSARARDARCARATCSRACICRSRPTRRWNALSAAHRQLLQVARALAFDCRILVLDEPTTALTDAEADHLFGVLDDLRDRGITILYVSHRLPEVFRLCDRITVLRDGVRRTFDHEHASTPRARIVSAMREPRAATPRPSSARWSAASCRARTETLGRRRTRSRCCASAASAARLPSRRDASTSTAARSSASSAWSGPAARSCSRRSSGCIAPDRGEVCVGETRLPGGSVRGADARRHRARARGRQRQGLLFNLTSATTWCCRARRRAGRCSVRAGEERASAASCSRAGASRRRASRPRPIA